MSALLLAISAVGVIKSIIFVVFVLCALLLILVVLLQEPKGGGLSGAFGGAGAETFGVQTGGVNKFTSRLAFLFIFLAVVYGAWREDGEQAASDRVPVEDEISGDANPGEDASGDDKSGDEKSGDDTSSGGESKSSEEDGG